VFVYKLSQQYWDVRAGDTLGKIVKVLLPTDRAQQNRLMRDIVELNPDAFINGDPNRVLANTRLWLPNAVQTPVSAETGGDANSKIEKFSWGSVKRIDP
jgi:Tfp pilus assembly protein FimV